MMHTIFVVDDDDITLTTTKDVLKDRYQVMTMPSAGKMFNLLEKIKPDLILLDIEMPEMDGFTTIKYLKAHTEYINIPVIFVTGFIDSEIEARGFEYGAVDFITKPFSIPVLLNRINTYLNIEEVIRERTSRFRRMQNGIIYVLSDIVEKKKKKKSGHIRRTTLFLKILLDAMKKKDVYASEIKNWDLEIVTWSARLHDIGKISISDTILNNPGDLSQDEFDLIKTHATEGERIIDEFALLTDKNDFLVHAKLFAGHHHEHWDGNGYPRALKGTQISLEGRIMAIVDVYDNLIATQSYRKAIANEDAIRIITENSGKQFDPAIVEVFLDIKDQFKFISENE
jgi:putative two-component system response regulator